ncbi:hypothetical protein GLE_1076 [Lysobacter enzymogenes]|uniref:Uncharacterized protein n=1 Tax=Lysobacter enzymogenes TaxID=69 RepID=A0A0S2DD11_LYSEN|nr:hypothetical protein GLE_1076 [Lysobacter enzymogenes]
MRTHAARWHRSIVVERGATGDDGDAARATALCRRQRRARECHLVFAFEC